MENKQFKLGIIFNGFNQSDIALYKSQLIELNKKYGDNLKLLLIGFSPEKNDTKFLDGVIYEYAPLASYPHYLKQLNIIRPDLIFIPLENNKFNSTTENIYKFIEAALIDIPIIVNKQFPYTSKLINNKFNGFMFEKASFFMGLLSEIIDAPDRKELLDRCAKMAHSQVLKHLGYYKTSDDGKVTFANKVMVDRLVNAIDSPLVKTE